MAEEALEKPQDEQHGEKIKAVIALLRQEMPPIGQPMQMTPSMQSVQLQRCGWGARQALGAA